MASYSRFSGPKLAWTSSSSLSFKTWSLWANPRRFLLLEYWRFWLPTLLFFCQSMYSVDTSYSPLETCLAAAMARLALLWYESRPRYKLLPPPRYKSGAYPLRNDLVSFWSLWRPRCFRFGKLATGYRARLRYSRLLLPRSFMLLRFMSLTWSR